jgi:hypothetical protein
VKRVSEKKEKRGKKMKMTGSDIQPLSCEGLESKNARLNTTDSHCGNDHGVFELKPLMFAASR